MTAAITITAPWPMRHDVRRHRWLREVRVADDRYEWQRLAARIRRRIAEGEWPVGGMMPTVRQFVDSEKLSDNTITRALTSLAEEGLIESKVGFGTRVIAAPGHAEKSTAEQLADLREQLADHEARLRALEQPED